MRSFEGCDVMRWNCRESSTPPQKNRRSDDSLYSLSRRWIEQLGCLIAAPLFAHFTFLSAASQEPGPCTDIHDLIEQSGSQFEAIRGAADRTSRGQEATFVLPDASSCMILDDPEKSSYRCVWKYPYGDEQAHQAFQRHLNDMRNCIGHMAEETTDQSVNHPDFYASYYFQLQGSAASVNLKNKAKLGSTLVSIRIDGLAQAN
ncbi:MAG: hypothetical protein ACR2Q4_02905 [Geminicoccaceae bacterium]